MHDHYERAQSTNVRRQLVMPVYSRVALVDGVGQLVAQLAVDADAALTTAASLIQAVEAGEPDEVVMVAALDLGGDVATAVATGYQVAAALEIADFDERVSRVLSSTLNGML